MARGEAKSSGGATQTPGGGLPLERFTRLPAYPWLVVGTVCVGAFMAALDASIVNIALPDIQAGFHVGINSVGWVAIAYLLTLTSLVVLFGRISDMVGRRTVYSTGFTVFIIGSALSGAAPSFAVLIGARVMQAVGAGMLQANSVAIVTAAAPPGQRGRAIGIQAAFQAIGLALGPTIGGLLVSIASWRAIFYVNVPVGIIGTLAGILILPQDHVVKRAVQASAQEIQKKMGLDVPGATLLALALVGVMFSLTQGSTMGWTAPPVLIGLGVFVFAGLAVVLWEGRAKSALIDPALLKIRIFVMGNLTGLLTYSITFGTLFLIPYELRRAFLMGPAIAGVLLTAVPLSMMAVSPFAGGLSDRFGPQKLTIVGTILMGIGTAGLGLLGYTGSPYALVPAMLVVGVGMGLFTPPNNSSVMGSVPSNQLGTTGGVLNMARSLGMSFGNAVAATLFPLFLLIYGGVGRTLVPSVNLAAARDAFGGLFLLSVLALMLSLGRSAGFETPGQRETSGKDEAAIHVVEW